MNRKSLYTLIVIACSILTLANCGEKKCDASPNYTMAVDSELTLLMRDMFTYYDDIKDNVKDGTQAEKIKIFREVHKAVATSPEKSSSELYQAMATIYVQSAERLNNTSINQQEAWNLMVDNCMNCHKQMCPGPMVRIKKLYLD